MAYNKAREERNWKARKEAEERQMRKLGVKEDIIEQLRIYDWKDFNGDQRYYRRLVKMGTYIEKLTDNEEQYDIYTVDGFLDSIENERLYRALCKVDRLTLQTVLLKIQGCSVIEIAHLFDMKEDTIYKRISRFKKKIKKSLK